MLQGPTKTLALRDQGQLGPKRRLIMAIQQAPQQATHLAKATWLRTWPINRKWPQILGRLHRANSSDRQELGQHQSTEWSQQSSAPKG